MAGMAYGYRPDPGKKGYLIIDEHEAVVVNLMYDKYLEFGSYCKVADWLNQQGYRTREYTSRQGKLHPAKAWSDSSVQQILQNPRYIGKRRTGDEVVEAVWEGIVSGDTWEKVQEMMKQNYKIRGNTRRANKNHTYLLGGLVYCAPLSSVFWKVAREPAIVMAAIIITAIRKKLQKQDCPHPTSIPVGELEDIVQPSNTWLARR